MNMRCETPMLKGDFDICGDINSGNSQPPSFPWGGKHQKNQTEMQLLVG